MSIAVGAVLTFCAFCGNCLDLLTQYQYLYPFHDSLKTPMPVEKCSSSKGKRHKKKCHVELQWQDSPEKFYQLLALTEKNFDMTDAKNLASPLGIQYLALKNFMVIYEDLMHCGQNQVSWGQHYFQENISLLLASSSQSQITDPCSQALALVPAPVGELIGNVSKITQYGDLPPESQVEEKVLLESLSKSVETKIEFTKRFSPQGLKGFSPSNFFHHICTTTVLAPSRVTQGASRKESTKNICDEQGLELLKTSIQEGMRKAQDSPMIAMSPQAIANDLNQRITKTNAILKDYSEIRQKLQKQLQEELHGKNFYNVRDNRERFTSKIKQRYQNELLRLKRKALELWHLEFKSQHSGGAGELLQTDTIKQKIGLTKLRELKPKMLGLIGFEQKVLTTTDDFPLLSPIDQATAKKAVDESFLRIDHQITETLDQHQKKQREDQRYLAQLKAAPTSSKKAQLHSKYQNQRLEKIERLAVTNLGAVGNVLINNPEYSNIFCAAARNLAVGNRNYALGEATAYIIVGGALTIASVLTLGGVLPVTAMIVAAGFGVSFSIVDYAFQKHEVKNRKEVHRQMLNAYLAGTGNDKTIDKIQQEWREIMETDYGAKVSLGLGVFDLLVIPSVARAGSFAHLVSKIDDLDTKIIQNKKLVRKIIRDSDQIKAIRFLINQLPPENIAAILSLLAKLPPKSQAVALNSIAKSFNVSSVDAKTIVKFAQSQEMTKILSRGQRTELARLMKQADINRQATVVKKTRIRLLKHEFYGSLLQRLPLRQQHIAIGIISSMSRKGKGEDEILRALGSLMAIPESLPDKL